MRLRLFGLGRRGGLCAGYQACKGGSVFHRDVGKDLAIERNARGFQAVNQLAIGQSVVAGGCADALDPELAILAFLYAAVALGVTVGAIRCFLCGLIELAFCEKEALCAFEILFTTGAAFCATFYACHGFFSLS